jgi:DNA-directed RNA polymerase subunit L
MEEDFKSLSKIVSTDFEVEELISEALLRQRLIEAFAYLLDHNISKMMNILYRTDVDEQQLKKLLLSNSNLPSAEVIADAYISRQKEKVETRKKYSR